VDPEPRPVVPPPDAWSVVAGPAATPSDRGWWVVFRDAALDALVDEALGANLEVRGALSRVAQADALARRARGPLWPQLDGVGSASAAWDREDHGTGEVAAGLALGWELDLFGRLRSAAEVRAAEREASEADLAAARLLLSARVADTWYNAVEQQLQLALLEEQRSLADTLVQLTELRFAQGDASAVDVLQQRSVLAEVQGEVPAARARLRAFEHGLDVLVGRPPDTLSRSGASPAVLPTPLEVPPLGVPAQQLLHRPDLTVLGRRVVAADHRIAEAMADRLPRVVLTGFAGYVDPSMGAAGPAASALGELVQPLLDWGQREAAVDFARAFHEEALLAFSQAYLVALQEVETTLWQEHQQRELLEALARRVDLLTRTVEGTRWRYAQGITDYLPVLTAVRELQAAQRELLSRRRELVSVRVQLFRALGGETP
jgi:NodT family efflux transporter outer membrane factor (OMF) lipoprotein